MHQPKLNSRVLKINVGFLMNEGPGNNHNSEIDFPTVHVSDDLNLKYLKGPLRLSCTKEGILVQATLETAIDDECHRCLDPIHHVMTLEIEELFAFKHSLAEAEFFIDEDNIIDLAPLLRAEVLMEQYYDRPCQLTAQGICPCCGKTKAELLGKEEEEHIDPRLAVLKQLLDAQ
ncbi:MAG: hypothetical protein Kow00117_09840 [Phototrophicales bacterium]|nr:MAG: hypothetical protein CUN56_11760 [Phototrophicales bacterium]RMG77643.1 MAG: DUF177 domain-containing protein [Chloroflexota bacterium]